MKEGDRVKVTGGNNEIGQPTMIGKEGTISSIGFEYVVKGKNTNEVYVDFDNGETHVFNDYHLSPTPIIKDNLK